MFKLLTRLLDLFSVVRFAVMAMGIIAILYVVSLTIQGRGGAVKERGVELVNGIRVMLDEAHDMLHNEDAWESQADPDGERTDLGWDY